MAKIAKGEPKFYTYKELHEVGINHYNDRGFCSVIAIAVACHVSYGKAYNTMKRNGRRDRDGASMLQIRCAVKELGYNIEEIEGFYGKQVKTMARRLSQNDNYMVLVRGHILAIRGGIVEDWTADRAHKVQRVYKITK